MQTSNTITRRNALKASAAAVALPFFNRTSLGQALSGTASGPS
jgi:hypothetical protein